MGGRITTVVVLLLCVLTCSRIGHCRPCEVYDQSDAVAIARCDSLIKSLEAALLTDNNLFILRNTFFSAMHPSPTALIVKYALIYNKSSDLHLDIANITEFRYGWTSSSVYAVVNPISILALETGVFGVIHQYLIEDYNSSFPPFINLDIRNTSIETTIYTEAELSFALKTITTQLKVYARYQGKKKSWDGKENKGYIWKFKPNPVLGLAELFLLLFVFLASMKVVISVDLFKRLQNQQAKQVFLMLFWGIAHTSFCWNMVDITTNGLYLIMLFPNDFIATDSYSYYAASKLVVLCLVLFFTLIWMLVGCVKSTSFPQPPKFITLMYSCGDCTKEGNYRALHCCAFLNISLFFFLVMANIIPVVILLFVHPVVVLSFVALVLTLFFSATMLFLPLLSSFGNCCSRKVPSKIRRRNFEILMYILPLLGLFSVVIVFVVILYLEAVIKGADPSDYIKILFSFTLSASLGGISYLVKENILKDRKQGENEPVDDEDTNQTDASLERIEEGRGATGDYGTFKNRGAGGGLVNEGKSKQNPRAKE